MTPSFIAPLLGAALEDERASIRMVPKKRIAICGMESINGVPVTDEMIQAWADEAERGYDVEVLRKRGRKPLGVGPSRVVPVRLDGALLAALDERARSEHLSRSAAIRAALRSYVA